MRMRPNYQSFLRVSLFQVIPSRGKPQMRRTLFDGYLFKYCSVKYQTFHQVFEKTSQQTYSHQKTTWKAFQMPPRAIKHQLTCPIELIPAVFWLAGEALWSFPGIVWLVQFIFFKFKKIIFSLLFTLIFTVLLLLFSLNSLNYHCHSNFKQDTAILNFLSSTVIQVASDRSKHTTCSVN